MTLNNSSNIQKKNHFKKLNFILGEAELNKVIIFKKTLKEVIFCQSNATNIPEDVLYTKHSSSNQIYCEKAYNFFPSGLYFLTVNTRISLNTTVYSILRSGWTRTVPSTIKVRRQHGLESLKLCVLLTKFYY